MWMLPSSLAASRLPINGSKPGVACFERATATAGLPFSLFFSSLVATWGDAG